MREEIKYYNHKILLKISMIAMFCVLFCSMLSIVFPMYRIYFYIISLTILFVQLITLIVQLIFYKRFSDSISEERKKMLKKIDETRRLLLSKEKAQILNADKLFR